MYRKSIALLLAISCIALSQCASRPIKKDGRIIGGFLNTIDKIPYIVHILRKGSFHCGGTLVAPNKVLTAAHCVHKKNDEDFEVVGGSSYLEEGGVNRKVIKIVEAANYNPGTYQNDYAILKLADPLEGDNIKTIRLCTKELSAGTNVTISGWGKTFFDSLAEQVNTIVVPVISKEKCAQEYSDSPKKIDSSNMICAGVPGWKDSCNGDSGGPLVADNEVCGIVSWGISCAGIHSPGVYTDVYNLRQEISAALEAIDN